MFLLDTNIISELMKKQPSSDLLERLQSCPSSSLCTATVCVMELRYGALRVPNSEAIQLGSSDFSLFPSPTLLGDYR
jgi:predicted nucleic acid-binding protein